MFNFFKRKKMVQPRIIEMTEKFRTHNGCLLCHMENVIVTHYIDGLLYERVNDGNVRKELAKARGYCPEHAEMLMRTGDALGNAILYADQLKKLQKDLTKVHSNSDADRIDKWFDHKQCPVCIHKKRYRKNFIEYFVEGLDSEAFRASLEFGSGLCLKHLSLVLKKIEESEDFQYILKLHREKYKNLAEELDEFIRKNDYRYRDEGFGKERNSWLRAIKTFIGFIPEKY